MDIRFYLNNQQVQVETGLSFTETLDESLDGGTVTLAYNTSKDAILPMTPFKIKDMDTGDTLNFVVILDSVERVSKTEEKFRHTLTVTQNTHSLTKHILRNSQFYNPHKPIVNIPCNFVSGFMSKVTAPQMEVATSAEFINILQKPFQNLGLTNKAYQSEKVSIPGRARISKAYVEIDTNIASSGYASYEAITTIPVDHWEKNKHIKLCVEILRYESNQLTNTLNLEANNGSSVINITNLSFFQNTTTNTKFQVRLSETQNSTFNKPSHFDDIIYNFEYTNEYVMNVLALVNLNLKIEVYYHTLYDVLDTINKQSKKSHKRIDELTYRDSNDDIYIMPSKDSEQGQLLDSIIAPDFSFTQKDIYSCVNDVFAYIDAIATLDENKVLGFEYFNDLDKNTVQNSDLSKSDIQVVHSDEYYTNKIQTQYQDGRQENGYYYPGKKGYRRISTKSYGVLQSSDYIFKLPYPIDFIDKVLLSSKGLGVKFDGVLYFYNAYDSGNNPYIFTIGGGSQDIYVPEDKLDITPAVVEQAVYQQLEIEESNRYNTQLNSLYYVQGQDYIQVGGTVKKKDGTEVEVWKRVVDNSLQYLLGETSNDPQVPAPDYTITLDYGYLRNIMYQVKYHAKYDGKVDIESPTKKTDGETYTAQGNSGVQISRMGVNMLGLVARLGNPQKVVSLPIVSLDERIKKGTIWIDEDGNKYIANKVKTTIMSSPEKCITEVEFSKDFNMLSQYIQVDKQKRFYEISDNITSTAYETISEYIYFDFDNLISYAQKTCISMDIINALLINTFFTTSSNKAIDYAEFLTYEYESDTSSATNWRYAPCHTYGCGNAICFEISYDSPLNAGDRVTKYENIVQGETVLYTADSGIADIIKIRFARLKENINFDFEFPNLIYGLELINKREIVTDIQMKYYKRPSEIVHLNYEIALLPKDNKEIYFGEKFITQNSLIHDYDELVGNKVFNLYASNTELYSIIDRKAIGNIASSNITVNIQKNELDGAINGKISVNQIVTCKSWCIADENGNIYIAANQELNNQRPELYFATRNRRIL